MPHPDRPTSSASRSSSTPSRPTTRRRRAARARAREATAAHRRRATRNRLLIRSGVLAGVLAAVTAVAVVLVSSVAPPVTGPRNLAGDGIRIGEGRVAERSPALQPGEAGPRPPAGDGGPVDIRIYSDFHCPSCGDFERENGAYLAGLLGAGSATVEYHPVAVVDRLSQGSKYSTRAAAAALCVADLAPDSYFAVNAALFERQPAPATRGLSTAELRDAVLGVPGLERVDAVGACVDDQRFAGWVGELTRRVAANATGAAGGDTTAFRGTPTVLIDGRQWDPSRSTLRQAVLAATAA